MAFLKGFLQNCKNLQSYCNYFDVVFCNNLQNENCFPIKYLLFNKRAGTAEFTELTNSRVFSGLHSGILLTETARENECGRLIGDRLKIGW